MRHIVCFSAGQQSAEVALSVHKKFGKVELLNHNICARVEAAPIKRFKQQIADHLGVDIFYVNHTRWEEVDQFDVCIEAGSFVNPHDRQALCTNRLKTAPFNLFLDGTQPDGLVLYYGFDHNETHRVQRRSQILGSLGYKTDFPLALWPQSEIVRLEDVGIEPPCTYATFKHANCVGCLKAKLQHWLVVYQNRRDIWEKAKFAENEIGHSIQKDRFLEEIEPEFEEMTQAGVIANENIEPQKFWIEAKKRTQAYRDGQLAWDFYANDINAKPCECSF